MTFDESVDVGVGILDGAMKDNIDSPDDKVVSFGIRRVPGSSRSRREIWQSILTLQVLTNCSSR